MTEEDEESTILFDELDLGITQEENLSFDNPSPQAIIKHNAHKNPQKVNFFILRNIIKDMQSKTPAKTQKSSKK